MRRRRGLSAASKILGRGASSSPPPSQFRCLRTTPTTLTRSTMSTPCSAQSGRTRVLAPQGRPWPLDRSKVNHAWFLFAVSPPHSSPSLSLPLPSSLLLHTGFSSCLCDLTHSRHPSLLPSFRLFVRQFDSVSVTSSPRPSVCVFWRLCDVCLLPIPAVSPLVK